VGQALTISGSGTGWDWNGYIITNVTDNTITTDQRSNDPPTVSPASATLTAKSDACCSGNGTGVCGNVSSIMWWGDQVLGVSSANPGQTENYSFTSALSGTV